MALTIAAGGRGAGTLCGSNVRNYGGPHFNRRPVLFTARNATLVVKAAKKQSYRTGKFRSSQGTRTKDQEEEQRTVDGSDAGGAANVSGGVADEYEGYFLPDLPGLERDFWEGPQWDGLGFFVQYMWAFGVGFALIACGIAVLTYNEGASDFKQTPAYKESIQSRDLLEEPEGSSSDVFESNPTEEAPSLE